MLDLIDSVLNPLLNSRGKNWIETTNSAEHSWQQHVERKNISTVQLLVSDPVGLGSDAWIYMYHDFLLLPLPA